MKKINLFINSTIQEKLNNLDKLTTLIYQFFSISTDYHLWPFIKNHRLIVLTDDPHFATQVRFQQTALCKHLSKCLDTTIRGLDIKLISLPLASFEQKKSSFQLSAHSAHIVSSIAQGIDDEQLKQAILRLSKTASSSKKIY